MLLHEDKLRSVGPRLDPARAGRPHPLFRRPPMVTPSRPGKPLVKEAAWSRLMAAAQDGDRSAYEQLLREIVPFIRSVALRQHRAPDRVDDVVQEVLLTLHRIRHTYDPSRPFEHWLATIARRRSIDFLRRRMRIDAAEATDELAYETFADPRTKRESERRDWAPGLGAAIAELPKGQREAIELLKLREMSLAEASRMTGKSIGALKVNVHRAIKALKSRLGR
jgi:RNA polymerase sigma factor (sigma-70 family)